MDYFKYLKGKEKGDDFEDYCLKLIETGKTQFGEYDFIGRVVHNKERENTEQDK